MIRAVIDTNIVISGLFFGGVPLKVMEAAIDRKFTHVLSAHIIAEIERVLRSKKFGLTDDQATDATELYFNRAELVVPTSIIHAIPRCAGDNRVLECAVDGKCQYIVTGDRRDLLSIGKFQKVQIITAKEFLKLI